MKFLLISTSFFSIAYSAPNPKTFITDDCTTDDDCQSGCCGFNSGKCAGPVIAQERDGGCGFGDPQPNDRAARIFRGEAPNDASTDSSDDSTSKKRTFITDSCTNDDDCESDCCGFNTGKCAGPEIAKERVGGCGFNGNPVVAAPPNQNPGPAAPPAAPKQKTFITDDCTSNDDCFSACCGFSNRKCAAPAFAEGELGGCDNGQPAAV